MLSILVGLIEACLYFLGLGCLGLVVVGLFMLISDGE